MIKIFLFLKQRWVLLVLLVGVLVWSASLLIFQKRYLSHHFRSLQTKVVKLKDQLGKAEGLYRELQKGYGDLQKKYTLLEQDRNNVLNQTKKLITERNQLMDIDEKYKGLLQTHAKTVAEKRKIKSLNTELQNKIQEFKNKFQKSYDESNRLKGKLASLEKERIEIENQKAKNLQKVKEFMDEIGTLKPYKEGYERLQEENKVLLDQNKELNQKLESMPEELKKLSHQNLELMKETARTHYNLGVFYTENQKYDRAIQEFQKAVDLNPDDAKGHYNLGFLYAEQYQNHKLAEEHFLKFLKIEPADPNADWIEGYLTIHGVTERTHRRGAG